MSDIDYAIRYRFLNICEQRITHIRLPTSIYHRSCVGFSFFIQRKKRTFNAITDIYTVATLHFIDIATIPSFTASLRLCKLLYIYKHVQC